MFSPQPHTLTTRCSSEPPEQALSRASTMERANIKANAFFN